MRGFRSTEMTSMFKAINVERFQIYCGEHINNFRENGRTVLEEDD